MALRVDNAEAFDFFTDSEANEGGPVALEGAWIHDPADAEGTVRQYRYGRDARSTSIDIGGTSMKFAGRTFPVVDYGEHQDNTYEVKIVVPHGPSYRTDLEALKAFAQSKTTLMFRDNRGRAMHGTMSGYSEADQSLGTEITFEMTRVHREEVTL